MPVIIVFEIQYMYIQACVLGHIALLYVYIHITNALFMSCNWQTSLPPCG